MDACCKMKKCGCKLENCDCASTKCGCHATGCKCATKDCGCTIKDCACQKGASGMKVESDDIRTISAEQLRKKMELESSLIVVNVLSEDYYSKCHIKDSINVPLDQLAGVAEESWNKGDTIVVYCANYQCPASRNAFKVLNKLGFKHLFAYEGGMKEWCEKGLPVVGECIIE